MTTSSLKQKAKHELDEFLAVFLFIWPFFLAIANYRMYLQGNFSDPFIAYGMSLVSALVLSKVILIGEAMRLGERFGKGSLLFTTLRKAAIFTIFYFLFHLLEEGIRGLRHGQGFMPAILAEAFSSLGGLIARLLFIFFAFIPFFALMETRRALGPDRFRNLVLHGEQPPAPAPAEKPRRAA